MILIVRGYQWVVSPALAAIVGPLGRCRFEPHCSQYAVEAIQKCGAIKGTLLTGWRLCRCQPWGGEGADPVPMKQNFQSKKQTPRLFHFMKSGADCCNFSHGGKMRPTGAEGQSQVFHG